jgi:hypothetical protein
MISSLVSGLFVFIVAEQIKCTKNMCIALMMLPALVCAALLAVNGNMGASIAVLGIFGLVRFRSAPGTAKDIVAIFYAMAAGLLVSTGQLLTAFIIILILGAAMIAVNKLVKTDDYKYDLKIVTPETTDFTKEFDPIIKKYSEGYILEKTKTTNMGSLYELTYRINPAQGIDIKKMIDELRVVNSNLPITYSQHDEAPAAL